MKSIRQAIIIQSMSISKYLLVFRAWNMSSETFSEFSTHEQIFIVIIIFISMDINAVVTVVTMKAC